MRLKAKSTYITEKGIEKAKELMKKFIRNTCRFHS